MKFINYLFILIFTFFAFTLFADSLDNHLFDAVLTKYVKEGQVNYKGLCQDDKFYQYIDQLAKTDLKTLGSEKEQLSFWINVYNAYTLKIICDNYPLDSINQLHSGGLVLGSIFNSTVWDKKLVELKGKTTTLNYIEHKIIRPQFKEPLIHFAIVCAAKGCPPLRQEAYRGKTLEKQLADQARIFLSDKDENRFNLQEKIAYLSSIFSWFGKDFGEGKVERLKFIAQFLPEKIATELKNNPQEWNIRYTNYDWSLNEQQ